MELIYKNIIEKYENIDFKVCELNYFKNLDINKNLEYPFIFNNNNKNYLYNRVDINGPIIRDYIERYIINDIDDIKEDLKYSIKLYGATHNFRFFNFNNKIYGIGGNLMKYEDYYIYDTLNQSNNFIEYNRRDCLKFFKNHATNKFKCNKASLNYYVSKPNIYCPFHGNGLYLFNFNNIDNNDFIVSKKLPIINGFNEGRHDGFYETEYPEPFVNMEKSKNGISVFDSSTSVLYNKDDKKYYLYQRANMASGIRNVQYCTSYNLTDWSNFELLKLNPEKNYSTTNIYYNNMFSINGVNNYIGYLPYNVVDEDNEILELYYSNDCILWNLIGVIHTHIYHKYWMVLGNPILKENKYYFYMSNYKNSSLEIYFIEKNRFSCVSTINKDEISYLSFKLMRFIDNCIKINFKTFENGYIKIQLKNKNDFVIDGYSFNDFNLICENMNEFEYEVSWKDKSDIPKEDLHVEIEGMNFNIYSINCNKVIYEQ